MFRFACRNLLSRPVRSALALLGLTVAIMGMVGLFSVAAGLNSTIKQTFGRVPGLAVMQPGSWLPLFSKIPVKWTEEIATMPGVRTVCREYWSRAQLVEGKATLSPPRLLFGVDVEPMLSLKSAVYRDDIVAGRFFQPADQGEPVCVISRQIASDYHKTVGETLRVDGYALTIVGIYQAGSLWLDTAIVLPNQTAIVVARHDPEWISGAYVEPDGTIPNDGLIAQIRERFQGRNEAAAAKPFALGGNVSEQLFTNLAKSFLGATAPEDGEADVETDSGLEVHTVAEWGARIQKSSSDLDIFLVLMNSIGIVIALLSILNTMLMSVSERLTEFGVLRANGWTAKNVIHLILAESAVLGLSGGVLGCFLGWAGTLALNARFPSKLDLYASPKVLLFSLVFSISLGMIGGLYPAIWSIRRSPMEAIRRG